MLSITTEESTKHVSTEKKSQVPDTISPIKNDKPAQDKRKLQVDSTSASQTDKTRQLCNCSGRKLEELKTKIQNKRKLVNHTTSGVRNVDMYKGKPNSDTIDKNLMTQMDEEDDPSELMFGPDGTILSVDCCTGATTPVNTNQPQIMIEPLNEPRGDPMLGLLKGLLGGMGRPPHMMGSPRVAGFVQMTKEHVLPNGQVEIERLNEPMQSTGQGLILGKPHIELDMENPLANHESLLQHEIQQNIEHNPFTGEQTHTVQSQLTQQHRMRMNPLTGLLSALPQLENQMHMPGSHGVVIAMSKPEIHTVEIPLTGPNAGQMLSPVHEEIIGLGGHPNFGDDRLLDRFIGDLLMHHERPDVDLSAWGQRNMGPTVIDRPSPMPEENDINQLLLKLMCQHNAQNRGLKAPSRAEELGDGVLPENQASYQDLRDQQISQKPDLNELMGTIDPVRLGRVAKVTKSKKTKKRKLAKDKQAKELDEGLSGTTVSKEQTFLEDLEHLGDSNKKLHKFKRRYKKYLTGLEKMYSRTSDSFKKQISKASFMKRALKNKTLFKQFLIKDLRRRNRKLRRKLRQESKRLISGVNSTPDEKMIGLSLKKTLRNQMPGQFDSFAMPLTPDMMFSPFGN